MKKVISIFLMITMISLLTFYLSSCVNEEEQLKKYVTEKIELIENEEADFESINSYVNLSILIENTTMEIKEAKSISSIDEILLNYQEKVNELKSNDLEEVENENREYLQKLAKGDSDYDPLVATANSYFTGEYTGCLGRGYNVITSGYFNENDVNPLNILDMNKLIADKKVYETNAARVNSKQYYGSSLEKYQSSISQDLKLSFSYGLFSKTSGDFNLSETSDIEMLSNSYFIKNQFFIQRNKQSISINLNNVEELQKYAYPDFLEVINADVTGTPEEINDHYAKYVFDTYGTHVLTNILNGGRFELNYVYHNTNSHSENTILSDLNATYSSVTSKVSGEVSASVKETASKFIENSSFKVNTIGGTTALNILTLEAAINAYSTWVESIENEVNLQFFDVASSPIPIWYFADKDKQEIIMQAYLDYSEKNGGLFSDLGKKIIENTAPLYIKKLYIGHGESRIEAIHSIDRQIGEDASKGMIYKTAVNNSYDLKSGARGDYVLIGYVTTTNLNEAIRDIKIDIKLPKQESSIPNGYEKLDYDLNAAYDYMRKDLVNRKFPLLIPYVYIYYSKTVDMAPIEKIGVEVNCNYSFGKITKGWSCCNGINKTSPADLNDWLILGSHPEIYLWVYRQTKVEEKK